MIEKEKKVKKRKIKNKFLDERNNVPPIVAKNKKQKHYLALLDDPDVSIVICTGFAGTGKSFVSACSAADRFRKGEVSKVIVTRPYVQTGRSMGSIPGAVDSKLYPYLRNVLDPIEKRLGANVFENAFKDGQHGNIIAEPIESIRGRSFDEPSIVLAEEMQQSTPDEMISLITRIGEGCKLIVSGDPRQKDIRGVSGLEWLLKFVERHKIPNVGVVEFNDPEDIVRSDIVKHIIIALLKEEHV